MRLRDVMLFACLAGCKVEKRALPELTWLPCDRMTQSSETGTYLRCAQPGSDSSSPTIVLALDGADLIVRIRSVGDGSTVTMNGKTVKTERGFAEVRTPVGDQLAKLSVPQYLGKDDVTLEGQFTLALASYKETVIKLPAFSLGHALRAHPETLTSGAIPTPATAPAAHTAVFGDYVIGPAKTLAEIDRVAIAKLGAKRESGTCSYSTETGGRVDVPRIVTDYSVTLYDRKGTVVETKDFTGDDEKCRSSISAGESRVEADLDFVEATAWIMDRTKQP